MAWTPLQCALQKMLTGVQLQLGTNHQLPLCHVLGFDPIVRPYFGVLPHCPTLFWGLTLC